jgi:dnd system-associated protein 4
MIEKRIRYARDKQDLIKRLMAVDEGTGPFKLQADVLAFAAAIGAQRGVRIPLPESTGEPIRQEVFDRQGYDTLINLVAVHAEKAPQVLAETDEMIVKRATAFEEYANGGLTVLEQEVKGQVDFGDAILLMILAQKPSTDADADAFDVSKLSA